MISQYQTSRQTFTAEDLAFVNDIPGYLRSVEAVMVNGDNELDGWKLTAHRPEYREALKAIRAGIERRDSMAKIRAAARA